MATAFSDQRRVAFSNAFRKQTTRGTALADALMNSSFPAALTVLRRVINVKGFADCSNLFLRRRQLQSRYYAIQLQFEGSAHQIGGFLSGCMGISAAPTGTDPLTHAITMLPPSSRELSYHTFIIGHDDASGEAWKYKDVCIAGVTATASAGQDTTWRVTVDLFASADRTAVTGWTWPVCTDEAPAQLYDSLLLINGVDYTTQTRSITCSYQNAVFTNDDPFTAGAKDVQRWRYGNAGRSYLLTADIEAVDRAEDTLAALLYANNDIGTSSSAPAASLRIGTAGEGVTILVPYADLTAADEGQKSAGEASEEVLTFIAVAKKAAGNAQSPMAATAVIPLAQQATAFEVAA